MSKRIEKYFFIGLITWFLSPAFAWSQSPMIDVKSGSHSVILQGNSGPTSVRYSSTTNKFYGERLGKKIVIRKMYIVPLDRFAIHGCGRGVEFNNCGDFYEAVGLYLEVQSIWPEPVLITAGRMEVISPRHNFGLGPQPGPGGNLTLDRMITRNSSPDGFLFRPGDVKLINLGQGFRLNGVLNFFDEHLSRTEINTSIVPYALYDLKIVEDFNRFLKQKYGSQAALKISLYEKDYKPLLVTMAKLGAGTDFFERGDPMKSDGYNFQHDHFVAEVLYQLRGGTESLEKRMRQ